MLAQVVPPAQHNAKQPLKMPKEMPPTPGAKDILDLWKPDPQLEGLGSQ